MKVGFVQFSPSFGKIDENIEKALSLIDKADAELIVLPELFNTGYLFISEKETANLAEEIPAGKTTKALIEIARQKKINIVAGLAEKASGSLYNSAVLITPEGAKGTYRKVHLFNEEKIWFKPGEDGFKVFDIGSCKIGIMICFDWFFPESARLLALMGADIICHPANLILPYCQDAMLTRCLENRVHIITANRTGIDKRGDKMWRYTGKSQITSADARILLRAGAEQDEAGSAEIDLKLARNKRINKLNDLFADRRTEHYGCLIK